MVFSFGLVLEVRCFSASAVIWRVRAKSRYRQSTRRWSGKTSSPLLFLPPRTLATRCKTRSELDFPHLGGVAKQVCQVVDKGTGNIHEVGFCRQCMESRLGPELATDQGEGVGEGGEGLEVPSRSAKRGDGRGLGMGEQRHQGKEAEQCRGRARDRTVGPLALGLHAEVGADLAKRHCE